VYIFAGSSTDLVGADGRVRGHKREGERPRLEDHMPLMRSLESMTPIRVSDVF
jgi:hypothetical protein